MRIRTVLDARPTASPRYLTQTLLLAHSWAAWGGDVPLDVIVVGSVSPAVAGRLGELGVGLTTSPPHWLDPVARIANKQLAMQDCSDVPVLVVDNDVCFLSDVSDLEGRNVRASVDSKVRISDQQWSHIETTTGLRPLEVEWCSPAAELAAVERRKPPKMSSNLYLNTGVVWVRDPLEVSSIWTANMNAIREAFDGHPLSTKWVLRSDQAAFAAAVATRGGFDLLSSAYNCRPIHFWLGLSEQPRILHLHKLGEVEPLPLSKTVAAYWDGRIATRIRRPKTARRADIEQEKLLDEAMSIRDRVLQLCADAGLDTFDFGTKHRERAIIQPLGQ
jgi:hypothetical protein